MFTSVAFVVMFMLQACCLWLVWSFFSYQAQELTLTMHHGAELPVERFFE